MMKRYTSLLTSLLWLAALCASAQENLTLTVELKNTWDKARQDAPAVIRLADLQAGFPIRSAVVRDARQEYPRNWTTWTETSCPTNWHSSSTCPPAAPAK